MYERLTGMLKMNDVQYEDDVKLSQLSSIRIGGRGRIVIFPDSGDKLTSVLGYIKNEGIPFRIVGRMTNILPPDEDFEIPVITTRRYLGFSVTDDGLVLANAGESLIRILRFCAEDDLGGCEALSGIPGTLGGLVTMNAGAFGAEISDFFLEARVLDIKTGKIFRILRDDMHFSYRSSVVKGSELLILSVKLKLKQKPKNEIYSDIAKYKQLRLSSQPTEPSLGSVFMRCGDVIPSRLIDEMGLRGRMIGGAVISEKHAGFIVNRGGATAKDFKALVEFIKGTVFTQAGVTITEEVEYL